MNRITKTFWDIETESLPHAELQQFMPSEWPLGNLKDPSKIAIAKAEKEQEWIERAALSAVTGRVLCIGIKENDTFRIISGDENDILCSFWHIWSERTELGQGATVPSRIFYGFNTHSFDLKFLIRRSMAWNIPLPMPIPIKSWGIENSIDLMDYWKMGVCEDWISLDNLAKHLGFAPKLGNGKDFSALWHSDRAAAEAYLKQDVELLELIAKRMGV